MAKTKEGHKARYTTVPQVDKAMNWMTPCHVPNAMTSALSTSLDALGMQEDVALDLACRRLLRFLGRNMARAPGADSLPGGDVFAGILAADRLQLAVATAPGTRAWTRRASI